MVSVVDEGNRGLAEDGNVWFPGVKGPGGVLWRVQMKLTITTFFDDAAEEECVVLIGKGGMKNVTKTFKLPSLALADDDAAYSFAQNVVENVKIYGTEGEGAFKFVF